VTVSRRYLLTAAAGSVVVPRVARAGQSADPSGRAGRHERTLCRFLRPRRGRRGPPCRRGVRRWRDAAKGRDPFRRSSEQTRHRRFHCAGMDRHAARRCGCGVLHVGLSARAAAVDAGEGTYPAAHRSRQFRHHRQGMLAVRLPFQLRHPRARAQHRPGAHTDGWQ
jgi:hypothetical protein